MGCRSYYLFSILLLDSLVYLLKIDKLIWINKINFLEKEFFKYTMKYILKM